MESRRWLFWENGKIICLSREQKTAWGRGKWKSSREMCFFRDTCDAWGVNLSCLKRRRGNVKGKSREEEMDVELDCIAACNSPDSGRFQISLDWKSFGKV